jgi:methionine-rich copper-binding protein CopC
MKRRISIAIGAALLLTMALFSVASAHAKLVSSDPAAGARLTQAPAKVTLVFDEEISDKETESFFNVTNEAGTTVGSGKLDSNDLDHKTLSGTLNSGLGDGVYTVKWQTITSDDNGKSEGSFTFGVNKDPSAQPTAAAAPTTAARPTATPAAAGAVQPTAAPAAGGAPTTLPNTGDPSSNLAGYFMLGAVLLLVAGAALLRLHKRA